MRLVWALILAMFFCQFCGDLQPSHHAQKAHERRKCPVRCTQKKDILALGGRRSRRQNVNTLNDQFDRMDTIPVCPADCLMLCLVGVAPLLLISASVQ